MRWRQRRITQKKERNITEYQYPWGETAKEN